MVPEPSPCWKYAVRTSSRPWRITMIVSKTHPPRLVYRCTIYTGVMFSTLVASLWMMMAIMFHWYQGNIHNSPSCWYLIWIIVIHCYVHARLLVPPPPFVLNCACILPVVLPLVASLVRSPTPTISNYFLFIFYYFSSKLFTIFSSSFPLKLSTNLLCCNLSV